MISAFQSRDIIYAVSLGISLDGGEEAESGRIGV